MMGRTEFHRAVLGLAAALGMLAGASGRAEAAFTLTMQQSGSDVVVNGSGTLNLAALGSLGSGRSGGGDAVIPSNAFVSNSGGQQLDSYSGLTGPSSFGAGGVSYATDWSGDPVWLIGSDSPPASTLGVPAGYLSGTALSSSLTFADQSLASLEVTPGTYVWTWGSGVTADSLTLAIGGVGAAPEPVPEPASLALLGTGLLGLGGLVARRHKGA